MDVNRLFVEILIVVSTEVACFLLEFLLIGKLLLSNLIILLTSSGTVGRLSLDLRLGLLGSIIGLVLRGLATPSSSSSIAAWTPFGSSGVDVCLNHFLSLWSRSYVLRKVSANFIQKSLNLVNLRLAKTLECASDLITKHLVELNNAALSWLSHVLESVC